MCMHCFVWCCNVLTIDEHEQTTIGETIIALDLYARTIYVRFVSHRFSKYTYAYYAIIPLAYLSTYMFYIKYYLFTSLQQLFATQTPTIRADNPPPPCEYNCRHHLYASKWPALGTSHLFGQAPAGQQGRPAITTAAQSPALKLISARSGSAPSSPPTTYSRGAGTAGCHLLRHRPVVAVDTYYDFLLSTGIAPDTHFAGVLPDRTPTSMVFFRCQPSRHPNH